MIALEMILLAFLIACAIIGNDPKEFVDHRTDFHVLQRCYVYYLGIAGVSGLGRYRGGSWRRCYNHPILCNTEKGGTAQV